MTQVNFNDKNTILVDVTDKYSLYYNTESKIISITNGIEQYGVSVEKLGDNIFTKKSSPKKLDKEEKADEQ